MGACVPIIFQCMSHPHYIKNVVLFTPLPPPNCGPLVMKSLQHLCLHIPLQQVPNYLNPDYLNSRLSEHLDVAIFSTAAEKRCSVHWSSATGESNDATMPFSASTRFRSQFTMSELAERSRECCSTLY